MPSKLYFKFYRYFSIKIYVNYAMQNFFFYPSKQIEVANKLDLLMGTEPNSQNVANL